MTILDFLPAARRRLGPARRARPDSHRRFRLPGHPANRAAGAREGGLLRDRAVPEGGRGLRGDEAEGVILSGGPASTLEKGAPRAPQVVFRGGGAGPRHLLRPEAMAAQLGGKVEGGHHREFGRAEVLGDRGMRACSRACGRTARATRLDEPRRPGHRHCRRAFVVVGDSTNAPFAASQMKRASSMRPKFHPEVVHTPDGAALHPQFRAQDRRLQGRLDHGRLQARRRLRESGRKSARARCICGLSGGVDSSVAALLIHEAIGDAAHLRVRRPWPDAAERGAESRGACSGSTTTCRWCMWMRATVHRRPGRRDAIRKQSARPSASCSSRCSSGSEEARRRGVPGPGHALSGRHRKRVVHRRPIGHHQVAPQCRRACRSG